MRTVLHTESSPGLGGQELRTHSEARWTAERGWRVLLVGQLDGGFVGQARAAGLEALGLRMRGAWDLGAVCTLRRLIRREQVSIVHTHSSVDGWVGGLAARAAGIPVVRTRHVSIRIRRRWNPVYRRLADRVITSGEAIRTLVIESGVDPGRVEECLLLIDGRRHDGDRCAGRARSDRAAPTRPTRRGSAQPLPSAGSL